MIDDKLIAALINRSKETSVRHAKRSTDAASAVPAAAAALYDLPPTTDACRLRMQELTALGSFESSRKKDRHQQQQQQQQQQGQQQQQQRQQQHQWQQQAQREGSRAVAAAARAGQEWEYQGSRTAATGEGSSRSSSSSSSRGSFSDVGVTATTKSSALYQSSSSASRVAPLMRCWWWWRMLRKLLMLPMRMMWCEAFSYLFLYRAKTRLRSNCFESFFGSWTEFDEA